MTIRDILMRLYRLDAPEGLSPADMRCLEEKFGRLPDALREFYLLAGGCRRVTKPGQDVWYTPEDDRKYPNLVYDSYFMLLIENQDVFQAAILPEDLGAENPPVYVTADQGASWQLCAENTEDFIRAALVYEAVFQFPHASECLFWLNDAEFDLLQQKLTLLPFHLKNWFGTVRLFQDAPDSAAFVLETDGEYQLTYGAATAESYEHLAGLLAGIGEEM